MLEYVFSCCYYIYYHWLAIQLDVHRTCDTLKSERKNNSNLFKLAGGGLVSYYLQRSSVCLADGANS